MKNYSIQKLFVICYFAVITCVFIACGITSIKTEPPASTSVQHRSVSHKQECEECDLIEKLTILNKYCGKKGVDTLSAEEVLGSTLPCKEALNRYINHKNLEYFEACQK